ncbi:hypothetical protein FOCC_FOCC017550, partial [Frankliniella occidentalis]
MRLKRSKRPVMTTSSRMAVLGWAAAGVVRIPHYPLSTFLDLGTLGIGGSGSTAKNINHSINNLSYTRKEVAFCGEDCRRAALSSYHRLECPLLRQLVAPQGQGGGGDLTPMALLAFRIVARAARLGEVTGGPRLPQEFVDLYRRDEDAGKKKRRRNKGGHLDGYGPVFAQVTHSEARTPADLLKRAVTSAYLTCCLEAVLPDGVLPEDEAQLLTAAFLRHLQSCSCNAYQVSEHRCGGAGGVRASRGVELGGACYPTVSLVNHACHPNVARHSHGSVCVVRAVRLIPEGSEVLDNYGPHFLELETEERRAALSKQYMFHCDCDACRYGWPTLEGLDRLPQVDP